MSQLENNAATREDRPHAQLHGQKHQHAVKSRLPKSENSIDELHEHQAARDQEDEAEESDEVWVVR